MSLQLSRPWQIARTAQARIIEHEADIHRIERIPGCPHCFPPGPHGDYRPGHTVQCLSCGFTEENAWDLFKCSRCDGFDVRVTK